MEIFMAKIPAPTKGNLMAAQNTLKLSKQGYEMLDKKRNILIREMMALIDKAKDAEAAIENVFHDAYAALESANIMMGCDEVYNIAHSEPIEENIQLNLRSVMGVELPVIKMSGEAFQPTYSFYETTSAFDEAFVKFLKAKELSVRLAEIETSVYRLAINIKKTQKRANALKNITIPFYEEIVKSITNALEEKEREEHTRMKIVKRGKE